MIEQLYTFEIDFLQTVSVNIALLQAHPDAHGALMASPDIAMVLFSDFLISPDFTCDRWQRNLRPVDTALSEFESHLTSDFNDKYCSEQNIFLSSTTLAGRILLKQLANTANTILAHGAPSNNGSLTMKE